MNCIKTWTKTTIEQNKLTDLAAINLENNIKIDNRNYFEYIIKNVDSCNYEYIVFICIYTQIKVFFLNCLICFNLN